jgi:hypothetical protein
MRLCTLEWVDLQHLDIKGQQSFVALFDTAASGKQSYSLGHKPYIKIAFIEALF